MTPPARVDSAALQQQIESIGARMDKGFDELKALMSGHDQRIREIEQSEAGRHPLLESRIDAAWRKIDEHGVDIRTLDTKVDTNIRLLASKVDGDIKAITTRADKALLIAERLESVAKWILGILTVLLTSVAYAAITGRVALVFK